MQFAPNRLKYLHEAGGGELGVEVECDFSANSREARGKQTKATCCVDHTAAYCAISPQVATADSTVAVAFRKMEASTGGQTHRTEHTEVMWGHPAKQTCASYHRITILNEPSQLKSTRCPRIRHDPVSRALRARSFGAPSRNSARVPFEKLPETAPAIKGDFGSLTNGTARHTCDWATKQPGSVAPATAIANTRVGSPAKSTPLY